MKHLQKIIIAVQKRQKTKGVGCIKNLDPKKMSKKILRNFTTNIFSC